MQYNPECTKIKYIVAIDREVNEEEIGFPEDFALSPESA